MEAPFLNRAVISAPFGTYIRTSWATSIQGSYTLNKRPGRLIQALKTIRPTKGGWVNRMGLRNPGLHQGILDQVDHGGVISIAAVGSMDWRMLYEKLALRPYLDLELNDSCPNVGHKPIIYPELRQFTERFENVIWKMSPGTDKKAMDRVDMAYQAGVKVFHACNTLPTDRGGASGVTLKPYSLRMVEEIRIRYDDATVIGGGGIYTPIDVLEYHAAGADHFSLASIWFTPWKVPAVKKAIDRISIPW